MSTYILHINTHVLAFGSPSIDTKIMAFLSLDTRKPNSQFWTELKRLILSPKHLQKNLKRMLMQG